MGRATCVEEFDTTSLQLSNVREGILYFASLNAACGCYEVLNSSIAYIICYLACRSG